jgi:hypothetical protein
MKVFIVIGLEVEGAIFLQVTIVDSAVFPDRVRPLGLRAAQVIGGRSRRPGVVSLPIAAPIPVINAVGVPTDRVVVNFRLSLGLSLSGRGVKATAQEFFGGGQAVVGLKLLEIALHHVNQEADGGAAALGLLADEGREVLVEGVLGQHEVPSFAGTTVGGRVGGDEGAGRGPAEVEELAGGVKAMAGLDVVGAALHEVDEEADDEPAVVGLLADDVGEG